MDESGATATSTTSTDCVHCGTSLRISTHESVQLLACPDGHGVFIHADALQVALHDRSDDRPEHEEQAAEQAQRAIAIEQLEQQEQLRSCPSCGGEMSRRVFAYESGVAIDVCDEHGVWLDDGELHRIEAWFEAQERHRDADMAAWGGQTGRLEQIEQEHEREIAEQHRSAHWGPVGWFVGNVSWWWNRRDDR